MLQVLVKYNCPKFDFQVPRTDLRQVEQVGEKPI